MSIEQVTVVQPHDEIVWVVVHSAELRDEQTATMQADVLAAAGQRPGLPVALDLSKVVFFPSLSLGAIVTIMRELKKQGRKFVLLNLRPQVRETLTVTRLDRLFEIHDSLEHALIQMRGGSGEAGG